jgi:hypothetical protein
MQHLSLKFMQLLLAAAEAVEKQMEILNHTVLEVLVQ